MAEPTAVVPDKGIRPGLNSTGAALAKHIMVQLEAGGSTKDDVELTGAGVAAYGATMEQIEIGSYGDVQIDGKAIATAGAAITVGVKVMVTAAGKVITATTGNITVGIAVTAAGADLDLIEVELAGPAGGVVVA